MRKKNRRIVAMLLVMCCICSLCACGKKTEQEEPVSVVDNSTTEAPAQEPPIVEPPVVEEPVIEEPVNSEERVFPIMDGSTSATPLEAGLRAEYQDISYAEALSQVSHTTTHQSFDRMLAGEVDMIFTVPISEEQQSRADEQGIQLVQEPVAREGFVFVVNIDNPVDSLTTEQIQKIYSGEITNWSEVGGNDEKILAYQRNKDSGSQNYMTEFMGDIPLMEPDTFSIPASMSGMMSVITAYDNSVNAIGYSVYSYAAQMYANRNEVKFIAVDGIAPTRQTMIDGTYPLLSCTYVMYPAQHERANEIKTMVDWIISEEGQLAVLACGYMPTGDMEIPESYLPYEAVGTGIKKPSGYAPSELVDRVFLHPGEGYDLDMEDCTVTYEDTDQSFTYTRISGIRLKCLTDAVLQDEINSRLAKMIERLEEYCADNPVILHDALTADGGYANQDKNIDIQIINGYMSITIGYLLDTNRYGVYAWSLPLGYTHYWACETLCYDLMEGREITELTDLFYQGVDVDKLLNRTLSKNITAYYISDNAKGIEALKGVDFIGLLGRQDVFSLTEVWFPEESPYFQLPLMFGFSDYTMMDDCVVYQYRDTDIIFNDNVNSYTWEEDSFVYDDEKIGDYWYTTVVDSRFYNQKEIDARNAAYILMQDRAREYINCAYSWEISEYNNSYELMLSRITLEGGRINFNKETYEVIHLDEVLAEGWQDVVDYNNDETLEEAIEKHLYSDVIFCVSSKGDTTTNVCLYQAEKLDDPYMLEWYSVWIPNEYIVFT